MSGHASTVSPVVLPDVVLELFLLRRDFRKAHRASPGMSPSPELGGFLAIFIAAL
jgi:hypothetical protein